MPKYLFETIEDSRYESQDGTITVTLETAPFTDNDPRWVLRSEGVFVDFDQFREDLAEVHGYEIVRKRI